MARCGKCVTHCKHKEKIDVWEGHGRPRVCVSEGWTAFPEELSVAMMFFANGLRPSESSVALDIKKGHNSTTRCRSIVNLGMSCSRPRLSFNQNALKSRHVKICQNQNLKMQSRVISSHLLGTMTIVHFFRKSLIFELNILATGTEISDNALPYEVVEMNLRATAKLLPAASITLS